MLNEPLGYDPREGEEWTPAIGLRRALFAALYVGLLLVLALALASRYAPLLVLPLWLRTPLAFGLVFFLHGAIERAAGMSDTRCMALAVATSAAVLASSHVVLACCISLPEGTVGSMWLFPLNLLSHWLAPSTPTLAGGHWLHPYVLLAVNVPPISAAAIFLLSFNRR